MRDDGGWQKNCWKSMKLVKDKKAVDYDEKRL